MPWWSLGRWHGARVLCACVYGCAVAWQAALCACACAALHPESSFCSPTKQPTPQAEGGTWPLLSRDGCSQRSLRGIGLLHSSGTTRGLVHIDNVEDIP
eukprot:scaffold271_cov112-Isochrysis_galbana.AAC.6